MILKNKLCGVSLAFKNIVAFTQSEGADADISPSGIENLWASRDYALQSGHNIDAMSMALSCTETRSRPAVGDTRAWSA